MLAEFFSYFYYLAVVFVDFFTTLKFIKKKKTY